MSITLLSYIMLVVLSMNVTDPKSGTIKAIVLNIRSSLTLKHTSIHLLAVVSPVVFYSL